MMDEAPVEAAPKGTFAKVECADCGNEQVVFVRAASVVTCQVCGSHLAEPTGGVASLKGTLKEYVD